MQIQSKQNYRISLLHLGFRPFFVLAGVAAVLLMAVWAGLYFGLIPMLGRPWSNALWHAHEMIFGYGLAVVAGFLLTAVRNWTGVPTLHGIPLLLLALSWLLARLMPIFPGPNALYVMVTLDILFNIGLCLAVLWPIVKVRQWQQMGIWALLPTLLLANVLFYLGLTGVLEHGVRWGLYGGVYLIVTLILIMGRRVIPFFIEKGADPAQKPRNHPWTDIAGVSLMLAFICVEVFTPYRLAAGILALALAGIHAYILVGWHTPALWRKPLLWVLYVGYAWIVLGFLMRGLTVLTPLHPTLTVHALAVGGIGMITLGMMSRVALGHTGRDVSQPPAILFWVFLFLAAGAVVRVLFTWALGPWYSEWIGLSQVLWLAAFTLFSGLYLPILIKPRIDGSYG